MASQGKKLINDPNGSLFSLAFFIFIFFVTRIASVRSLFVFGFWESEKNI